MAADPQSHTEPIHRCAHVLDEVVRMKRGLDNSVALVSAVGLVLLTVTAAANGPRFYAGADVSMLPHAEQRGFRATADGKDVDLIALMMQHGCNTFRVRKFVAPAGGRGVVQDLPYVVALGKRIKDSGGLFLLDLHYSDTWADPRQQRVPAAWRELTISQLEKQVEEYTREVLQACRRAGCAPDFVQIGNEIQYGILKPFGGPAAGGNWDGFGRLVRAGVRGVRGSGTGAAVILHTHAGGDARAIESFSKRLRNQKVDYDYLGVSFYCRWEGPLENLEKALGLAAKYGKPVIVVETSYPYYGKDEWFGDTLHNYKYPCTPQGQHDFLKDLIRVVREAPNGIGRGVLWWHFQHANALFDDTSGEMLPALRAFGETGQK